MANAKILDGRSWSVDVNGITSLSRRYLVESSTIPQGLETEEVAAFAGVPSIGTAHSGNANLVVTGYEVAEGQGANKKYTVVTVKYTAQPQELSGETVASQEAVESWGWRSGTVSRDLTHDEVTHDMIINSAGDPFDSVPQVDRPSPMFTKVLKTKARKSGWMSHVNKLNDSKITIGGIECPICTLRVMQVDEERLIGDPYGFKYRYTIGIQYLSNRVKIEGATAETEIGWDIAFVDQGCRGLVEDPDSPGTFTKQRLTDEADGEQVPVSLPVLLNGQGGRGTSPFMIKVAAYARTTIPQDFYSEPS